MGETHFNLVPIDLMPDANIMQMLEMSPAVMRDWVMRVSRGSEITGLQLYNEILPDGTVPGPNGQTWARHKLGSHRTVTVQCGKTAYTQTFIKRDDGWAEVKEEKESSMDKLEELVYISIGHASMCWNERPTGVFDSAEASKVAEALLQGIRTYEQEMIERERAKWGLSHPHIIRDANGQEIARSKGL